MTIGALLIAAAIGAVMGLLGAGGSILAVPALTFLLQLPPKDAVAMALLVVGLCAAAGVVSSWMRGVLPLKTAVIMGLASSAGAFAGSAVGAQLSDRLQLRLLAAVMLAAAAMMAIKPRALGVHDTASLPQLMALGAGLGVITGIVGVGGGFLMVPALSIGTGLTVQRAAAVSLFVIMASAMAALPNYLGHLTVSWRVIAPFTLVAATATIAGGVVAQRLPQQRLRQAFAFALVLLASYVLIEA